jgi:uncharacterized protein
VPAAHPVLNDKRITAADPRAIVYQAVVRIPVGTVLREEIAFRGVPQAALRRVMPGEAVIITTGGMFGIWHIRPWAVAGLPARPAGRERVAAGAQHDARPEQLA